MPKKNNSHTELLAERLKAARLFAGFETSLKFAKALGVNQKLYNSYELGEREPPINFLRKVRNLTGCSINFLIAGQIDKTADAYIDNLWLKKDDSLASSWSSRLNQSLEKKGWSAAELSRKTRISYASVAKYLEGSVDQPRNNRISQLASALDVSVLWLKEGIELGSEYAPKNRIAELRKEKRISQSKLANKLDTDVETIVRFEKGIQHIGFDHIKQLAKIFKIQPKDIFEPISVEKTLSKTESNRVTNLLMHMDEEQKDIWLKVGEALAKRKPTS